MSTVLRRGDAGPAVDQVVDLLTALGLLPPSPRPSGYDEAVELAVRTFQQQRGLHVDGTLGPDTFRRLDEARWQLGDRILTHRPGNLMAGDDVFALQQRLLELGFRVGRVDGFFGRETEAGLRDFQRDVRHPRGRHLRTGDPEGARPAQPAGSGGAPNAMRAQQRIREDGPQLGGKVVVVDPAPCPHVPAERREEALEIVHDVAERIEGRLVATGVQAFLTALRAGRTASGGRHRAGTGQARGGPRDRARVRQRGPARTCASPWPSSSPRPPSRAGWPPTSSAPSEHEPGPRPASGSPAWCSGRSSPARIWSTCAATPKAWDFLRRTRMPAVQLDAGYL